MTEERLDYLSSFDRASQSHMVATSHVATELFLCGQYD